MTAESFFMIGRTDKTDHKVGSDLPWGGRMPLVPARSRVIIRVECVGCLADL